MLGQVVTISAQDIFAPLGTAAAPTVVDARRHDTFDAASFQALRTKMEKWTRQMMTILGIDAASPPIIWDADFLYGPRTASGEDSFVLCEINVRSVFAIPDQAPAAIARLTLQRLEAEPLL
jgi:uncharacterized protein DUF6815